MEGERKEDGGAANPLTRKLNKILNGGEGGKAVQGPSEVRSLACVLVF
jgi:hypothetical protein